MRLILTVLSLILTCTSFANDKKPRSTKIFKKVTVNSVQRSYFGFDTKKNVGYMDLSLSVNHVGCMGNWHESEIRTNKTTKGNVTNIEIVAVAEYKSNTCRKNNDRIVRVRVFAPERPDTNLGMITLPQIFSEEVATKLVIEYSLKSLEEPRFESYRVLNPLK